jgi:transposase InsO family protein
MLPCVAGCVTGRRTIRGAGSATPTTMPAPRAGTSTTRRSSGYGAWKACGCRNAGGANAWAPPRRRTCRSRTRRTRSGRSTSEFDATTDGRPVKIVSILDEHTRECLGGLVDRSITANDLIDELDHLAAHRGYPAVLRCDNGPELACTALADWAGEHVGLHFIPPGQPWRNGYVESFNAPGPRRVPQHQRLLVTGPRQSRDQRLEGGLQPPPTTLLARLPGPSGLRCCLHPPLIDSHPRWISSWGPATGPARAPPPRAALRAGPAWHR